tara:strand:- start:59 stop:298 length:240 start_codon:yes stop_codon:yes gene_type:complete
VAITLLAKIANSKAEQYLIFIILFTPRWFTLRLPLRVAYLLPHGVYFYGFTCPMVIFTSNHNNSKFLKVSNRNSSAIHP